MIWLISDTHFFHKNILIYEGRPFASIDEMNATIIRNWRKVVNISDVVFHLGDVSFGDKEGTSDIIHKLPGKKILILGNHDRAHSNKWFIDVGFQEVYSYPIIYEDFFILSHEPVYLNNSMPYINIHGHLHGNSYDNPKYINVGVEHIGYTPFSFEEIKTRAPINQGDK